MAQGVRALAANPDNLEFRPCNLHVGTHVHTRMYTLTIN